MSDFDIRPHHGLCTQFFVGKGYSSDFTENMAEKISLLRQLDPVVRLIVGTDIICEKCPNNTDGNCSGTKPDIYDARVLDILDIQKKTELKWSRFLERVRTEIIVKGRLSEVCNDCQWFRICEGMIL